MTSNIQLFQQPDLSEDAAMLLIREELGIKAHSVLGSREVLSPGWKLLPSAVGMGRLLRLRQGCLSLSCFRKVETVRLSSLHLKVFCWLMSSLTLHNSGTSARSVAFLVTQMW